VSVYAEIEKAARVMGWQFSRPVPKGIVMWRGGQMIDMDVSDNGVITRADRFEFVRLDDLHFKERANRHPKATVLGWLATDW
jgi:hypothetical protein